MSSVRRFECWKVSFRTFEPASFGLFTLPSRQIRVLNVGRISFDNLLRFRVKRRHRLGGVVAFEQAKI